MQETATKSLQKHCGFITFAFFADINATLLLFLFLCSLISALSTNIWIAVSFLSLTPLIAIPLWSVTRFSSPQWLRRLSLLSIGSIVATLVFHFLPEHDAHIEFSWTGIILGLIFSALFNSIKIGRSRLNAVSILSADYLHNLVNAFTLVLWVSDSPAIWFSLAASLFIHELVHKAGNYGLLISTGNASGKSLLGLLAGIPFFLVAPLSFMVLPVSDKTLLFLSTFATVNLAVSAGFSLAHIFRGKSVNIPELLWALLGFIPVFFVNLLTHPH